ncbi:hypothetical protein FBY24_1875 [Cellulomonas sp. SLBN-39]|nr:hypothetical protein FBY24_1875 [Cellulomonas sp. SLBN-39]
MEMQDGTGRSLSLTELLRGDPAGGEFEPGRVPIEPRPVDFSDTTGPDGDHRAYAGQMSSGAHAPAGHAAAGGDDAVLAAVGAHLGVALVPRTFVVRGDVRVSVDGTDAADASAVPRVLVLVNGGTGQLKSLQRNKLIADAFKLDWLRGVVAPGARALLAVTEPYARLVAPGAWLPAALRERGIDVLVVGPAGSVRDAG